MYYVNYSKVLKKMQEQNAAFRKNMVPSCAFAGFSKKIAGSAMETCVFSGSVLY